MKGSITLLMCAVSVFTYAQNVGIGTKDPQNKLHVAGGLRIDSLAAKKDSGLILHNKTGDVYSISLTGRKTDVLRGDGTFAAASAATLTDAWLLGGNAGTDESVNFLGTLDTQALKFRVNNLPWGYLNPRNSNVALGRSALNANTSGSNNVAIGREALQRNTEGLHNVAIGTNAMRDNTAGGFNSSIGYYSLLSNTTGSYNTAIGYGTLSQSNASHNTAIGADALHNNRSGYSNTAVGTGTMVLNAIGNDNTALGAYAMFYNEGSSNTGLGSVALHTNRLGNYNTATGMGSLKENVNGSYNSAFGYLALFGNVSAKHNTGIGAYALNKTTGEQNSALGSNALANNITGINNTSVGYLSMSSNQSGSANTASGAQALGNNTTGVNNAAFGYGALGANASGSLNTAVGMFADVTAGNLVNATAIGYGAKVNASNKVRIGNASVTVIEGQVPFTTPSDGRFKFNVKEDVSGLDFILKLRPVTYQFDVKKFDRIENISFASAKDEAYEKAALIRRTGFIAQEVEKAAEETHYNFSGIVKPENEKEHYALSYESFVVPLVKAVQELSEKNEKEKELIEDQEKRINQLMQSVEQLKEMISKQQQMIDQLKGVRK